MFDYLHKLLQRSYIDINLTFLTQVDEQLLLLHIILVDFVDDSVLLFCILLDLLLQLMVLLLYELDFLS